MSRLILEISGPRVGSTNFRRNMEAFATVEALGEFFNRTFPLPQDLLDRIAAEAARTGTNLTASRDALTDFALADPVRAVELALAACAGAGRPHPVLKLAPGHLSAGQMAALVARFAPFGVVLHRDPVDQFISREKALALKAWESVNTTDMRPAISAKAFRGWRWRQQNHFQMGTFLLRRHGCPILELDYATLYADPAGTVPLLRDRFQAAGLDLGPAGAGPDTLPKQDRASEPGDKVRNWDAFLRELSEMGREGDLAPYDLTGRPLLMRLQFLIERTVPRRKLRQMAGRLGISGMPAGPQAASRR